MSLSTRFETVFGQLVTAWTHHQDLKARGASAADLVRSRHNLDQVRLAVAQARAADVHHIL